MSLTETYRSFVNTWECDENNHWNVQFYFRAFQQAREVFLAETAGTEIPSAPELFHVRYLQELSAAQSILIRSGVIGIGEFAGWLVHLLENSETGELCATCLDRSKAQSNFTGGLDPSHISRAMPRGVKSNMAAPDESAALLADGSAIVSHKSVVRPFEVDHHGDLLFHAIISRFTDCASHVWTHAGLTTAWLEQNQCGRVAVETKLTRLANVQVGSPLRIVSRVADRADKSFAIVHQLENLATGKPVAHGEVRCVVMDLTKRRVIALPHVMKRIG